jgi:hypothetical protein
MTISRPICPFCGEEIKTVTGACYQCGKGAKEVMDANLAAIEAEFTAANPTPQVQKNPSRFLGRKSVMMILVVTGIIAFLGGAIFNEQREARWAELRESDPAAYLTELREVDVERWFTELRGFDPEAHIEEAARRAAQAETERLAECTDQKVTIAYVMRRIQRVEATL